MRIAVFSDVHGNYAALDAVLADIRGRRVDATIALGDLLSGPFDPRAVASRMMQEKIPSVRGNHDRWLVDGRKNDWPVDGWVRDRMTPEHRDWLGSLPAAHVVADEVFMCHGTPADDNTPWLDQFNNEHGIVSSTRDWVEAAGAGFDYPVLLCGHTHVPRTLRLGDGRLVINPGTVGLPFLLGSPDAHYAVIEKREERWSAELIAIAYDREAAMAQARENDYPGFAMALETGWARLSDL
jgi:putative phosphoesterase